MATRLVPLTADLIDEGQFLQDINEDLRELQEKMAMFRRTYGSASAGAKGKLVIELEFKIENVDDDAYSLKSLIKTTHPKRPANVSLALGGEGDDGKLALFVRQSGSDSDSPEQMKLATRDGRTIDPATGQPHNDA